MTVDATPAAANVAPAAPESKPTAPTVDVEALIAKVADYEAVKADNAKYREERRLLKEKQEEHARKAGDLEPLLKERESEIERMKRTIEELSPLAARAKVIDEQRAARVADKAKALSAEDRAVIDAVTDLDAKEKLIDRLSGPPVKPEPPPNAGSTSGVVNVTAADIEAGRISPNEARTKHPKVWRDYVDSQNKSKSPILAAFRR